MRRVLGRWEPHIEALAGGSRTELMWRKPCGGVWEAQRSGRTVATICSFIDGTWLVEIPGFTFQQAYRDCPEKLRLRLVKRLWNAKRIVADAFAILDGKNLE
jgi:hypothetical protein